MRDARIEIWYEDRDGTLYVCVCRVQSLERLMLKSLEHLLLLVKVIRVFNFEVYI